MEKMPYQPEADPPSAGNKENPRLRKAVALLRQGRGLRLVIKTAKFHGQRNEEKKKVA